MHAGCNLMCTTQAIFDSVATALAAGLYERGCFNRKGGCTDSTSKSYVEAVSKHTAFLCVVTATLFTRGCAG